MACTAGPVAIPEPTLRLREPYKPKRRKILISMEISDVENQTSNHSAVVDRVAQGNQLRRMKTRDTNYNSWEPVMWSIASRPTVANSYRSCIAVPKSLLEQLHPQCDCRNHRAGLAHHEDDISMHLRTASSGKLLQSYYQSSHEKTASKSLESVLKRRYISALPQTELSFINEGQAHMIATRRPGYLQTLEQRGLFQGDTNGFDWSGKGQHVEFREDDDVPLQVITHIAASANAIVDKVRCKRVIVARKMMRFTRRWKLQDALVEIEHLSRLRHAHIVQLVGSYLLGRRNFAILLYPVADCHLGTFLQDVSDRDVDLKEMSSTLESPRDFRPVMELLIKLEEEKTALRKSLACLSHALEYIHGKTTKHMDIKPANILVKRAFPLRPAKHLVGRGGWNFYIADFGLSKHFQDHEQSQTIGPIGRTPKWCAPEVYDYDSRGRAADIFSLGCVFVEILTVIAGVSIDSFSEFRREGGSDGMDDAFRLHVPKIHAWLDELREKEQTASHGRPQHTSSERLQFSKFESLLQVVRSMVELDPQRRPTANFLASFFRQPEDGTMLATAPDDFLSGRCCSMPPEPFVIE